MTHSTSSGLNWVFRYNGWMAEGLDLVVLFVKEAPDGKWAYHATVQKIGTRISHGYADSKEQAMNEAVKAARIFLLERVKRLSPQADLAADAAGIFDLAQQGQWGLVQASLRAMSQRDVREFGGVVERLEYHLWEELKARKTPTPTLPQQKGGRV